MRRLSEEVIFFPSLPSKMERSFPLLYPLMIHNLPIGVSKFHLFLKRLFFF